MSEAERTTIPLTREAFHLFWWRYAEVDEPRVRSAAANGHAGDCCGQSFTCPVCLIAGLEREEEENWGMLMEACNVR